MNVTAEMFGESRMLAERLRRLVPARAHAYSKAFDQWPATAPPILTEGRGAWVWDADGHAYVDWFAGLSSVPLGHAHPVVAAAVAEAISRGSSFQLPSTTELDAAETFLSLVAGDQMVKFAKNASDAVDAAIKLARYATGRTLVAKCADHPFFSIGDWFIGTTAARGGTLPEAAAHTRGFPYNNISALTALFDRHGPDLAAIICEPVRFTPPDLGFFAELRRLADRHGTVVIFDETVTGLKYHLNGARTLTGITPDLTVWGKGIANGLPVAALTGRADLMSLGDTTSARTDGRAPLLLLSSTHGGETVGLSALIATVRTMAETNVLAHTHATGADLRRRLSTVLSEAGLDEHIRLVGYDCFLGIDCYGADGEPSPELKALFIQEIVRCGALFRGIFYTTAAHHEPHLDLTTNAAATATRTCISALSDGFARHLRTPLVRTLL
ncbi:MAG: aminotransferase class III-fold pyridoxal phosphate-dependent enzyme [Pseudonocardiaceae bacterium]